MTMEYDLMDDGAETCRNDRRQAVSVSHMGAFL